ncbi:hypothetical protein P691DRAFT_808444, partial [Macrolepiota fuliginosa MF-IS2]
MALPQGRCIIQTIDPTIPPKEADIGCLTSEEHIKIGAKRVYYGIDVNTLWELEPVNSTGFNVVKMFNAGGSAKDNEDLLFVYYIGPHDAQEWILRPQPDAGKDIFEIEAPGADGIMRKWAVSSESKQIQVLPLPLAEQMHFCTQFRIIPFL